MARRLTEPDGDYVPPTLDEIRRVGEYWRRAALLTCEHEELTIDMSSVTCSECNQPVRILSDIQIEEMKRR